jgi:VWFA-related protein
VKRGWATATVWVSLAAGSAALIAQAGTQTAQQAIPDSPRPQVIPNSGAITPGKGAPASTSTAPADDNGGVTPGSSLPANSIPADAVSDDPAPDIKAELGPGGRVTTIRANVNFVQVPFTVKDKSGALVPAIDWREVRVFENGTRRQLRYFSSDPYPLSVAFVIDQSLPFDVMGRVNTALGAVQGAFTPYDEMAIFTYNNGPTMRTDYTGAQSARIGAIIERSKTTGREAALYTPDGPLSQTNNINGHNFDPNTAPVRNSNSTFITAPKETHTLNDAIWMAAQSLAKRPDTRRRVIYVVSDGKEAGSTAKYKDVLKLLQANKIALYATVVGDSATPYVGFLDHYHIPFTMRENILPQYAKATGGEAISEYRSKGIETSFAKIAEDVRVQYTAGYYSNEPITDGKFRTTSVTVLRPGLDVISKTGYYPTPENAMRNGGGTGTAAPPR